MSDNESQPSRSVVYYLTSVNPWQTVKTKCILNSKAQVSERFTVKISKFRMTGKQNKRKLVEKSYSAILMSVPLSMHGFLIFIFTTCIVSLKFPYYV